jgi:hypothetical protein
MGSRSSRVHLPEFFEKTFEKNGSEGQKFLKIGGKTQNFAIKFI